MDMDTAMAMASSSRKRTRVRRAPAPQPAGAEPALDSRALYRLMTWLSPSYPTGAFSYSSGIEWAVESGDIKNAATLQAWLAAILGEGGGFCDAVFLVHAFRAAMAPDDAPPTAKN